MNTLIINRAFLWGPGLLGVDTCLASRISVGFDAPGLHKKYFVELEKSSIFVLTVPGKDSGHRQAGKQPSLVQVFKKLHETVHLSIITQLLVV